MENPPPSWLLSNATSVRRSERRKALVSHRNSTTSMSNGDTGELNGLMINKAIDR